MLIININKLNRRMEMKTKNIRNFGILNMLIGLSIILFESLTIILLDFDTNNIFYTMHFGFAIFLMGFVLFSMSKIYFYF